MKYLTSFLTLRFVSFKFIKCCLTLKTVSVALIVAFSMNLCFVNAETDSNQSIVDLDTLKGIEDEFIFIEDEQSVTIASKIEESIRRAPSVVSVITAKEIENMGARTLYDIMRIVPGFDLRRRGDFNFLVYGVRGIWNADDQVKIFLNGHSLNVGRSGRTATFFDDFPLKNVKKIEIIRGPGSALYGTNAFLATINIITKDANDIETVEVSAGFGSYDAEEYSILASKSIYGVDINAFVNFYNTNGPHQSIEQDALFGAPETAGARAPGRTDEARDKFDISLDIAYNKLKFSGKYFEKDTEPYIGSNFVLTEEGESEYTYAMADISYEFDLLDDRLRIKPRAYFDYYQFDWFVETNGNGFTPLDDAGNPVDLDGDGDTEFFPDGKQFDAYGRNRVLGGEIQMDYDLFDNNNLIVGFGYEWNDQDNIDLSRNFDSNGAFIGEVTDQGNELFVDHYLRQVWNLYFQDKWNITDDLDFTFGVRHDHYSDFEGTTNPRMGLVWDFTDKATIKLLYGQAFRAPSFRELTLNAPPVGTGNSSLEPEKIRTYEVSLGYRFTDNFSANVNYFYNVIRDQIATVFTVIDGKTKRIEANTGSSNVQGIEFETRANLSSYWRDAYVFANYTYQDAESSGDPLPDVPKHQGNVGVNVGITKYLNANLHAFISDSSVRAEEDSRDDVSGYAILNLTLIAKEFFNDLKVKASLFNLLNKEWEDPSLINTIPGDLPRPGRNFFIEFEYKY